MKIATILAAAMLRLCSSVFARLGDTEEQAQARYGLQKTYLPLGNVHALIPGAREMTFEYQGWKIRCALLTATDGKEYIVREEYSKSTAKGIPQGGPYITDAERDAILQGEVGTRSWHQKLIGEKSADPIQLLANQIAHTSGLTGKVWIRDDGAIARTMGAMPLAIVLDLPQSLKHEAEVKSAKGQELKASIPQF